ncbi:MAG: hypothetical protein K9G33_11480, partial [Sneathiella sp.]|nr:hypothetical protein [Sneathiella sp.]
MNKTDSWIFLFLGLFGGFAFSAIFWWITNHFLVPDIQFSPEISRSKVSFIKSGTRHQMAIKNNGKRDAFNVKIRMRMKIKDILQSGGKLTDFIEIAVKDTEYFVMKKGSMFRVTPLAHLSSAFSESKFPSSLQEKFANNTITLDDVFEEYKDAKIYMEVIATDKFSGGAKYFRSREYERRDIRNGVFLKKDHLS